MLGAPESGQPPLAVAGRPTPNGCRMHSKVLRRLLPRSPTSQTQNGTTGVTKIPLGRLGRRFLQLALVGNGQFEQTRPGHTRDCIPQPNYAQYLVKST